MLCHMQCPPCSHACSPRSVRFQVGGVVAEVEGADPNVWLVCALFYAAFEESQTPPAQATEAVLSHNLRVKLTTLLTQV